MILQSASGRTVFVLVVILTAHHAARAAGNRWMRAFGGSGADYADAACLTADGGYFAAGATKSFGSGGWDGIALKLDGAGNVSWARAFGGSAADSIRACVQASDGGYFLAGYTTSSGAGSADGWCMKLDGGGGVVWSRTYGGSQFDDLYAADATSDGGYVVVGFTNSYGVGGGDGWCLRLDSAGNPVWQKTYGGSQFEGLWGVEQTADGGFVAAGSTESFAAGDDDGWCMKLDSAGIPTWQRAIGSSGYDELDAVQQTSDGGYVLAGHSDIAGPGTRDGWCLKLSGAGATVWQKTYGEGDYDRFSSIAQTGEGGYLVAGWSRSSGAGGWDAMCLKLDSAGNSTWARTYGGSSDDYFATARPSEAGAYVLFGNTTSYGASSSDVLFVKTGGSTSGEIDPTCGPSVQVFTPVVADAGTVSALISATVLDTVVAGGAWGCTVTSASLVDTLVCASPAAPDLIAEWTKLKTTGSRVRGTLTCRNAGSADAGSFLVDVYLSKKGSVGRKATKVKTFSVSPLAAGATKALKIKTAKASRHKFAVAKVDSDEDVAEDDETNNLVSRLL